MAFLCINLFINIKILKLTLFPFKTALNSWRNMQIDVRCSNSYWCWSDVTGKPDVAFVELKTFDARTMKFPQCFKKYFPTEFRNVLSHNFFWNRKVCAVSCLGTQVGSISLCSLLYSFRQCQNLVYAKSNFVRSIFCCSKIVASLLKRKSRWI